MNILYVYIYMYMYIYIYIWSYMYIIYIHIYIYICMYIIQHAYRILSTWWSIYRCKRWVRKTWFALLQAICLSFCAGPYATKSVSQLWRYCPNWEAGTAQGIMMASVINILTVLSIQWQLARLETPGPLRGMISRGCSSGLWQAARWEPSRRQSPRPH